LLSSTRQHLSGSQSQTARDWGDHLIAKKRPKYRKNREQRKLNGFVKSNEVTRRRPRCPSTQMQEFGGDLGEFKHQGSCVTERKRNQDRGPKIQDASRRRGGVKPHGEYIKKNRPLLYKNVARPPDGDP